MRMATSSGASTRSSPLLILTVLGSRGPALESRAVSRRERRTVAQLAHHAATQRDAPGFDPTPGPRALIGGTEPASGDTDGFPDTDLEDAMIVACEGQQIARDGVRYLVDGIIPDYGTVGFSVAFAKVGKTTFSQGLAAAVAMGRPFLDRATTRAKVLVLAAEDPAEYTAWLARHLDVEAGWMTFRRKSLILDPHGLARARTTIARGGYGFVLIASWQAVVRGLIRDENDNAGAVRVVEDVKAAARLTGVPWLIDAHSGKGEDQHDDADPSRAMRGASSAAGAADYTLSLRYANGAFGAQRRLRRPAAPEREGALRGVRARPHGVRRPDEHLHPYLASQGRDAREHVEPDLRSRYPHDHASDGRRHRSGDRARRQARQGHENRPPAGRRDPYRPSRGAARRSRPPRQEDLNLLPVPGADAMTGHDWTGIGQTRSGAISPVSRLDRLDTLDTGVYRDCLSSPYVQSPRPSCGVCYWTPGRYWTRMVLVQQVRRN